MAVRWAARCTERRHRGTGIVPLAAQGRPGTAGIGFFFGTYINVVTSVSFSQRRREGRLSGFKIRSPGHAAIHWYSWMSPPRMARLLTREPATPSAGEAGSGGRSSSARCGLSRLYLRENAWRSRLYRKGPFTYGPDTGMRGFGRTRTGRPSRHYGP